jgi:hypothetical protein
MTKILIGAAMSLLIGFCAIGEAAAPSDPWRQQSLIPLRAPVSSWTPFLAYFAHDRALTEGRAAYEGGGLPPRRRYHEDDVPPIAWR